MNVESVSRESLTVGQIITVRLPHGCGQGGVIHQITDQGLDLICGTGRYERFLAWGECEGFEIEVPLSADECLEYHSGDCQGVVDYRMALTETQKSYPRCDFHWEKRLKAEEGLNERYPLIAPHDFDHMDAGEYWGPDDY